MEVIQQDTDKIREMLQKPRTNHIHRLQDENAELQREVRNLRAGLEMIRDYALSSKFNGDLEDQMINKQDIVQRVDQALNPYFWT